MIGSATINDHCLSQLVTQNKTNRTRVNTTGWRLGEGATPSLRRYCYDSLDDITSFHRFVPFFQVGVRGLNHSTAASRVHDSRTARRKITASRTPTSEDWNHDSSIHNLSLWQLRRILRNIKHEKVPSEVLRAPVTASSSETTGLPMVIRPAVTDNTLVKAALAPPGPTFSNQ